MVRANRMRSSGVGASRVRSSMERSSMVSANRMRSSGVGVSRVSSSTCIDAMTKMNISSCDHECFPQRLIASLGDKICI
jgi:hypothetical protein